MKKLFWMLLAAIAFAACTDDGEDLTGKDIQLADGVKTDLNVYADQTAGTPSEGIRFTTTGAWRAEIKPVTKATAASPEAVDWVTVTPDHGDTAGDYTVRIELKVNATGETRKATVSIVCGSTVITITIEQRGETEEGKVPDEPEIEAPKEYPHLVQGIRFSYIPWKEENDKERLSRTYDFTYDDRNRVTEYTIRGYDYDGEVSRSISSRLDYGTDGEISFTDSGFEGGTYRAGLNTAGYIAELSDNAYRFGYDAAGHLTRMDWSDGGQDFWAKYTYNASGILSGGTIHDWNGEDTAEGYDAYFSDLPNDQLNLDINMLFMEGIYSTYDSEMAWDTVLMGRIDRLAFLRLAGKGSDCYIKIGGSYDSWSSMAYEIGPSDKAPGTTWTETSTFVMTEDDTEEGFSEYDYLDYTLEADGRLASVAYYQPMVKIEQTSYYRVTDEVVDWRDEKPFYRVECYDTEEKVVARGKGTYIYRFTYKE